MAEISSKNRNFSLLTPLDEDELIIESFSGKEEISRLFSYTLALESPNDTINFDDIVGQNVTLSILLPDLSKRFINGFVSRFSQSTESSDLSMYHLEMVPWLWFLTQTTDCRIFQEKTAPDIIKQIFDDAGFAGKYEDSLSGTYEKREYCVQYRETDFNFVSRLMEEEGICYFFKHEKSDHKLVLADAASAHTPIEPEGDLEFFLGGEEVTSRPSVTQLSCEQSVRPTAVSYSDYNFKEPSTGLLVTEQKEEKFEIYDYPGNYKKRPLGEKLVKVRLEEERTTQKLFSGATTDRRLTPGFTGTLIDHPRDDFNATYLLTSIYHNGSQGGEETTYECSFACIPSDVPFRPEQITEKPVVTGVQTAVVTGPSGEEIWLDKYGRIKVQFHWDREGRKDDKSSCWIRVAQNWAGKNWGIVFHPRIGQEVIVQFEEGDIDHPIVTGRVYNEEQMPPYELPKNSTQSTVKSRSSKKGQPDNFNEIKFEDKKGEEQLFIQAEKDLSTNVKASESRSVGASRSTTIGTGDSTTVTKKDSSLTVSAGNRIVDVTGGDYKLTSSDAVKIHGKGKGVDIKGDTKGVVVTGKGKGVTITGNDDGVTITGNAKGVTVTGNAKGVTVTGKGGTGIKGDGDPNVEIKAKTLAKIEGPTVDIGNDTISIHGKTKIELKVGGSSITIESSGITIVSGGNGIGISSKGVAISGSKIGISSKGVCEMAGQIVKIN